ncbi:MAG: hypothetical protein ACTS73_04395 [Arsenophonus sp. NEOnobi-MAG3]
MNNTINNLSSEILRIQVENFADKVFRLSNTQILEYTGSSVLAMGNQFT